MTHQQLSPSKKPCNKCGGIISWDIATRERLQTKLPLNMDGTVHDKASCELVKREHPGLPASPSYSTTERPPPSSFQVQPHNGTAAAERIRAIDAAHKENMKASNDLKESIEVLSENIHSLEQRLFDIDRTLSAFVNFLTTYLETRK